MLVSSALINSVGNLGGFISFYIIGALNDTTKSFSSGLITLAVALLIGKILTLAAPKKVC